MSLVVDSSAVLAWVHGDERTPEIEAVFDRVVEEGAIVPHLWHLEVANSLTVAVRRKRIAQAFRDDVLKISQNSISLSTATLPRMRGARRFALPIFTASPSMMPPIWSLHSAEGSPSQRSIGIWQRPHAPPASKYCRKCGPVPASVA